MWTRCFKFGQSVARLLSTELIVAVLTQCTASIRWRELSASTYLVNAPSWSSVRADSTSQGGLASPMTVRWWVDA